MVIVKPLLVHSLPPGTELPLPTDRGRLRDDEVRTKADQEGAARQRFPVP